MANDLKNLHMQMDADVRLAAAAGGVARFLADAAGLQSAAIVRLQATVIAACTEAFEHLTRTHPQLEVDFVRHADRIEVALSHEGEASPPVGPHSHAGLARRPSGNAPASGAFAGVDRVQYETHGSQVVTRFTKYLVATPPGGWDAPT